MRIKNQLNKIPKLIWGLMTVLMGFIFVMMNLLVVLRYFFNTTIVGGQEIVDYSFIYLTAIGAALLINSNDHISVNLFEKASVKTKTILKAIQYVFMLALQSFLLVLSIQWIQKIGHFLTPVLHFEQRWAQYSIPLSMFLGICFCITNLFSLFSASKNKKRNS